MSYAEKFIQSAKHSEFFFIFCIKFNVDIDEMLLLEKNKGHGINSFGVISL